MWHLRMICKGRMQRRHGGRGDFKSDTEHQTNTQGPLESSVHERTDARVEADVCADSGPMTGYLYTEAIHLPISALPNRGGKLRSRAMMFSHSRKRNETSDNRSPLTRRCRRCSFLRGADESGSGHRIT